MQKRPVAGLTAARSKALAEAELRVLEAQVEPHFLFNTQANIGSLIHTHPDRASRLLERLTSLLRASLSRTRIGQGTLGEELESVRAYLDIQAVRMGGRMTREVDADAGLEPSRSLHAPAAGRRIRRHPDAAAVGPRGRAPRRPGHGRRIRHRLRRACRGGVH